MHLLQSSQWGTFKSEFGWSAQEISLPQCNRPIQVLYRRLPLGFNLAYIPKGPTIDWQDQPTVMTVLTDLKKLAAQPRTVFLKIEPDVEDSAQIKDLFGQAGFQTARPVQPTNTIILDIAADEDDILKQMKSKTRYNIRLAARKGVTVRLGDESDIATFYELSQVTGERDGFSTHPAAYYQSCYNIFTPDQRALLVAEFEEQPLAAVMVFASGQYAYYLYGASNNAHRNKMPAYLLQWEAIRWAKSKECHLYDFWGIPDASPETLEAEFQQRSDGLWGVYRFKRGFGGRVMRSIGAFDFVHPIHWHKQLVYQLYTKLLDRQSTVA